MTEAQWLFEYHALRKKEDREFEMGAEVMKAGARILRDTLIGVLGLNLLVPKNEAEAATPDAPAFIPAAALMSNHHLLKIHFEAYQKAAGTETAMADAAFEEFSKKLARGDVGDLDPLLLGNLPGGGNVTDYWAQASAKQMLAALGIKPRPTDAPAVPHFGKRPKKVGRVQISFEGEERLLQEQEDARPTPLDRVGPAPLPRTDLRVEIEPGIVLGGEDE